MNPQAFDRVKEILFAEKPTIVDARCSIPPSLVGSARIWAEEAITFGRGSAETTKPLMARLAHLFTRATVAECDRGIRALETAGFLAGYDRRTRRLSLAGYGHAVHATLRATPPTLSEQVQ